MQIFLGHYFPRQLQRTALYFKYCRTFGISHHFLSKCSTAAQQQAGCWPFGCGHHPGSHTRQVPSTTRWSWSDEQRWDSWGHRLFAWHRTALFVRCYEVFRSISEVAWQTHVNADTPEAAPCPGAPRSLSRVSPPHVNCPSFAGLIFIADSRSFWNVHQNLLCALGFLGHLLTLNIFPF